MRCLPSRLLLSFLMAWCVLPAARAQPESAPQRERIARERQAAEAAYAVRERECSERFVVTACLDRARAERRAVVDALRREEDALDAAERRRRADQRLEIIRQKTEAAARAPAAPNIRPAAPAAAAAATATSPSAAAASAAAPAPVAASASAASAALPAAAAGASASTGGPDRVGPPRPASVRAAAERAAASQQRQAAAAQRLRERAARQAETDKRKAAPLPPVPAVMPAASVPPR